MRLGVGSAWTSLTGLGVLLVAAGCELPVPDEGSDLDSTGGDSNEQYRPGTDPTIDPRPPGGYEPPIGGSPTAPRKLALDLNGVAGFASLDDEADGAAPLGALGGGSLADASSAGNAMLRLESSLTGQVLTRSLDGLSRQQLLRSGLGVPGFAQEDPSGDAPLPSTGDGSAPLPSGAPASDTQPSAGERAGLLKITADGQIAPALVELASEPPPATSEPSPPEGSSPTGEAPAPAEGGTSGGGTTSSGAGAPPVAG